MGIILATGFNQVIDMPLKNFANTIYFYKFYSLENSEIEKLRKVRKF